MIHVRALYIAAFAFLVSAAAASAAPQILPQWRSLGPAVSGGRLGAVAGTNADPALYYVGAADGGVWKTTDAGTIWRPVFDAQDVQSIGAIAIDPSSSDTVWVGTGEANPRNDVTQGDGVYKSVDGGATWTRVLALRNALVSAVILDPKDTAHVIVGVLGDPFADNADRGIYRTLDGGRTWSKTLYLGPSSGASDLVADPSNPDIVYAGMWQFRRTGWGFTSGGPRDGLYRSTDGGGSWAQLTGHGLPSGPMGRIAVAIAPSNPQRIYALIQSKHGMLWRSDDGGSTWSMIDDDPLMDERPFYFSHIFVDPRNPNRIWSMSVHLTLSTDGGKTFAIAGRALHGDHHAMWIAADGKRMIEGNDGGVGFSSDGGATWLRDNHLAISQPYHVGLSRGLHYRVCAPLQDNGIWCAPSDPQNPRGMSASQWRYVGGGDGTWALFDPLDARYVWTDSAGGNFAGDVELFDLRTGEARSIAPYSRDQNVIDPKDLRYRLNWEAPLAFDPFDPARAYAGADVLFETQDRGERWQVISPDLTADDRAHEVISGGITLDGTGAETSATILAVEPSPAVRGEIWVGTDDGVVQLTRDGGHHWTNVTPAGILPDGRFASIAASPTLPGVAYAIYDRHMVGDRTPYVFATTDFGAHWRSIASGIGTDDEARSILVDPRNPHLLYLGLERTLLASWDDGTHWESIRGNLPAVSVHDITLQPDRNDLVIATHGRGVYVLDDATPLQQLHRAIAAGTYVFAPRTAYLEQRHSYWGTAIDAPAAPYGAIVAYYLARPARRNPTAEIFDAHDRLVRRFTVHLHQGAMLADLPNAAGLNRFTWDLTGPGALPWRFAPAWNRGYEPGAAVLPGAYTVQLNIDGAIYKRRLTVAEDPRLPYTGAQLRARREALVGLLGDLSRVDAALNELSTVELQATTRASMLRARGRNDLAAAVELLGSNAHALVPTLTSNPQNDQDDDFLPDVLRERLQTELATFDDSFAPPTQEQQREAGVLHALTLEQLRPYESFAKRVKALDAQLAGMHLPSLRESTAANAP